MASISSSSALHSYRDYVLGGNRGSGHGRNSVHFLDMCTETLGSETGAMCPDYEMEESVVTKTTSSLLPEMEGMKQRHAGTLPDFPPPLTTLRGEGRLRLERKREEGRLLLYPFKPSLLEADRSGGRLLLRYLPREAAVKETVEETEAEEEELPEKDENGDFFFYGGGRKYRRAGRCVEEQGGGSGRKKMTAGAIFKFDTFWVASS